MPSTVRPSWSAIPDSLRDAITARIGAVAHVDSPPGGFTPGLATRLRLSSGGEVFIKALPTDHALAGSYRHEAAIAARLPAAVPSPVLRWHEEMDGWLVLAYDAVDGRHPDIGPSGGDLPAVVDAIAAAQVPAGHLPRYTERIGPWLGGWSEIAADPPEDLHPWAAAHLDELAGSEQDWLEHADGSTLVHGDIRADNILVTGEGAVLVDWALASSGARWLDLTALVPQMILAGHTPASAERHLARLDAWREVPASAVTSYAAAHAGYWTRAARQPSPPGAMHLRQYQNRAGRAAIEWAAWRRERSLA